MIGCILEVVDLLMLRSPIFEDLYSLDQCAFFMLRFLGFSDAPSPHCAP